MNLGGHSSTHKRGPLEQGPCSRTSLVCSQNSKEARVAATESKDDAGTGKYLKLVELIIYSKCSGEHRGSEI